MGSFFLSGRCFLLFYFNRTSPNALTVYGPDIVEIAMVGTFLFVFCWAYDVNIWSLFFDLNLLCAIFQIKLRGGLLTGSFKFFSFYFESAPIKLNILGPVSFSLFWTFN